MKETGGVLSRLSSLLPSADRRTRSASVISMPDSLHLAKVVEGDLAWP
jgi:hypothetical protein